MSVDLNKTPAEPVEEDGCDIDCTICAPYADEKE